MGHGLDKHLFPFDVGVDVAIGSIICSIGSEGGVEGDIEGDAGEDVGEDVGEDIGEDVAVVPGDEVGALVRLLIEGEDDKGDIGGDSGGDAGGDAGDVGVDLEILERDDGWSDPMVMAGSSLHPSALSEIENEPEHPILICSLLPRMLFRGDFFDTRNTLLRRRLRPPALNVGVCIVFDVSLSVTTPIFPLAT